MQEQTFYQKNQNGRIKQWSIKVEDFGINVGADIVIVHGLQGGKMQEVRTSIIEGKNIGKINETTYYEQACLDAQTEINKQVKKGYVDDINNVKESEERETLKAPMKPHKYHPTGKTNSSFTLEQLKIKNKPIYIQRKLDGFRYIIHVTPDEITFHSSSGDVVLPFPQIANSIRKSFDKIYEYVHEKYGVNEYYLDGEIYRHHKIIDERGEVIGENPFGGFQNVSSACQTQVHITPEKQELRDQMQFYLFDVCIDAPYTVREKILNYFIDDENVIRVENYRIINANEEEIERYFNLFLSQGYEGVIIRQLDKPYEYKRTKQILKYKPLIDDEFKIVGFKKSITGETVGSFECILPDGRTFFANPKDAFGTDKVKKEIWDHQEDYIGKWITVEFLEYSNDKIPRHPRAKGFRKGQSID